MKLEGLKITGSKRIKKPDFKLIFVKVFAVTLMVAMGISLALSGKLADYEIMLLGNANSNYFYYLDKMIEALDEGSVEDMDPQQYNQFMTACSLLSSISYGPVSINFDGEEIYNSENSVIGQVRVNGEPFGLTTTKIDPADWEKCQKLDDYSDKFSVFYLLGIVRRTMNQYEPANEIYVNLETREFYPTKINVCADSEWGFIVLFEEKYECIDTIDLTPADMTLVEGMAFATWKEEDDHLWSAVNAPVNIFSVNGELKDAEEFEYTVTYKNGSKHKISLLYNNSTADRMERVLLELYIGNFLLATVLLSLIISMILYFRAKSIFDVFEYRRKTTEAMAHDLKTPLAITSVYVDNLKESLATDKERCQYHAEQIEDSVKYLNSLVNNILEYSNSQREDKIFAKEEIDVRKEIDEYVTKVKPTADAKGIKIKVDGADSRKTDKKLWTQSIANLIDNAIKHGSAKGEITITIAKNLVEITNSVEVDIAEPMRFTEPFVKGAEERGENTGSGLGLAIAKNNLERLGFKLAVTCQDKKFTVRIR